MPHTVVRTMSHSHHFFLNYFSVHTLTMESYSTHLVRYDPVANGENLLNSVPLVFRNIFASTQPGDEPREEISRHSAESTGKPQGTLKYSNQLAHMQMATKVTMTTCMYKSILSSDHTNENNGRMFCV